ncbi:unnamed protein product [Heterobilharzia americana]|nr:unnamed protein product [Heterobilharzia americana]
MDECINAAITPVHFQRDAEEASATIPSLQNKSGYYTMAGILDFLQLEWSRMQLERTQWDVERAELQAKIAFLQGKFKGLENLRNDLIRRIKMLEYALIRERNSKTQNEHSKEKEEAMISLHFTRSESVSDHSRTNMSSGNGQLSNDDFESEAQQITVSPKHEDSDSKSLQHSLEIVLENCSLKQSKQLQDESLDYNLSNSSSFDYLSFMNESDLTSTTEPQSVIDPETAEALLEFEQLVAQSTYLDKNPVTDHVSTNLVNSFMKPNESRSKDCDSLNEQELLQHFKEQYRADRLQATSRLSHHSSLLFNMNLKENSSISDTNLIKTTSLEDNSGVKRTVRNDRLTNFDAVEDELDNIVSNYNVVISEEQQESLSRNELLSNATTKVLSNNPSGTNESTIRLEDLANLTNLANELDSNQAHAVAVAMDNLDGMGDCITNKSKEKISSTPTTNTSLPNSTTWTAKYTLRSHFDAIRGITFHPNEPVLVTCSEDHTLKLWNLNKTIQTKKSSIFDVEPIYTFRGHNSPVLSITMLVGLSKTESSCQSGLLSPAYIYSGDLSGCIRSWCVPSLQLDPYDTFDLSIMRPSLEGHTDAVWSLCSRYDGLLLSTSADGTSRLWHLFSNLSTSSDVYFISNMLNKHEYPSVCNSIPTSATFLWTNLMHFAAGFTSGHVCIFNLETNQIVRNFQSISKTDVSDTLQNRSIYSVNSVISHPHFPLIISAHDDRQIRFWDSLSGKCVHSLTAHLDSVTTLSIDSKGTSLLSASHDCSIRIWDINTKTCIQEITGHRKKMVKLLTVLHFIQPIIIWQVQDQMHWQKYTFESRKADTIDLSFFYI